MGGKNLLAAFSNSELPEQSKEALQSEAWQKAREAMGAPALEIKADAAERTERNNEFHHGDWKAALHEYLKTAYKGSKSAGDLTSGGTVYQFMEKDDKVTFYDEGGNTLFHVGYEQLEKEYAVLMREQETDSEDCQDQKETEENGEAKRNGSDSIREDGGESVKAEAEKMEDTVQKDTVEETMNVDIASEKPASIMETGSTIKEQAKKKLEKELGKAKDRSFSKPVIEYLIKRCEEDNGLSEDVIQEHKAWTKCYAYIHSEAQKSAQKGAMSCAVRDDVVYEWAEDYYHKDDKAEEERKAKKAAEARKKAEERKAEAKAEPAKKAARAKEKPNAKTLDKTDAVSDGIKKGHEKPKKNTRDMEGQMDMFSMMGI
ncbi:MAG: PcfK-like family protein [Eubacterium sp.]|nr:PcfK-like family protein [Eubacterium sp.]